MDCDVARWWDLSRRILLLQKRLKRSRCKSDASKMKQVLELTLLVYIWGGHDLEAATLFWKNARKSHQSLKDLQSTVEDMHKGASAALLLRLAAQPPLPAIVKASTFLMERGVFIWLQKQNRKGVAPHRPDLIAEALARVPIGLPTEADEILKQRFVDERSQNHWLQKFRLRWNARLGRLPVKPPLSVHLRHEKAVGFYRWCNAVLAGHENPVILNMDECSLKLCPTGNWGTVVRGQPDAGQAASLHTRRNYMTLLATICSDLDVARLLPQVVLGNERQISRSFEAAVAADPDLIPDNNTFLLWRRKSAWVNAETIVQYLEVLCRNLEHLLPERLCVLLLDACPAHLQSKVLASAQAKGLRLIVVPSQCTSWLQPLDLFVFRSFRAKMEQLLVTAKCGEAAGFKGNLTLSWLRILKDAVQQVICNRPHKAAFEKAGVSCRQQRMCSRVARGLGWTSQDEVPETLPTVHQAALLFPQKRKCYDVGAWLHFGDPPPGLDMPIPALD
eukprot:s3000_g1.t1